MPPATPLRARGAEFMMARLLGAWKKPKPAPHSAMRHTNPAGVLLAGRNASNMSPAATASSPSPPSMPAAWRSASLPASGAATASASGQGVMNRPVATAL